MIQVCTVNTVVKLRTKKYDTDDRGSGAPAFPGSGGAGLMIDGLGGGVVDALFYSCSHDFKTS